MRYRYFVHFQHNISVFANFSYGIAVLGTPQCPPLWRKRQVKMQTYSDQGNWYGLKFEIILNE